MKIIERRLDTIKPYERNPRRNDAAVNGVAESLRQFGWKQPIVIDSEGVIVAGHTRYKAALSLGWETAPCVVADDLTPEQVKAYRLADNKVAEASEWDMDALNAELAEIINALPEIDMADFGFDLDSVSLDEQTEAAEDDYNAQPPAEPKTKRGDIYQLGRHRLMCGDATIADDVRDLMGGHRADVCFTSPPYNMGASMGGGWESVPNRAMRAGAAYSDYSDNLADDDYADLLIRSVANAIQYADDVMYNVGLLSKSRIGVIRMLAAHENEFGDIVVWNKSQSMPFGMDSQRGLLAHRCEMIFCFNRRGIRSFSHPQWEKGCGINRIDTNNGSANKFADVHAATFPVEFAAAVISNFTESSVLDLFGGTGTTMIAAEQLGRSCYMMELDPMYCDMIVDRWEKLTGEKAVLIQ